MNRITWPLLAAGLLAFALPVHGQTALPEGPGRAIVQASCVQCHTLDRVTTSGYTREGWRNQVAMMTNTGAKVPADQVETLVAYLAANFPEKPSPTAVIAPAAGITVTIKEWAVPTLGSRPHDPLAAADGSIWYTAHGRPARAARSDRRFTEFRPPTPESGPHGLTKTGRQHLVHRELQGRDRQARPAHRRVHQ